MTVFDLRARGVSPQVVRLISVAAITLALCGSSQAARRAHQAPSQAGPLTADNIQNAHFPTDKSARLGREVIAKAQILLAQAHFSPGEVDARDGENFGKALKAFAAAQNLQASGKLNSEIWDALNASARYSTTIEYQVTEEDLKGPFAKDLPTRMEDMKDLPGLPYRNVIEALAEKFHMSEELLKALNPQSTFSQLGETIRVANTPVGDPGVKAARVEIDKKAQTVRAFDGDNKLIAFYPATVGSREKPSPSGDLKVTAAQKNPTYRYNPEYAFKGVSAKKPFTIKPGPNNPVGTMWIGLSEKGYGIHGTPEPAKVSKAESHGCVRLTNWDAEELSQMVGKGTPVAFVEGEGKPRTASR
jgi:lipoprotein-anchoring transpeptidase ErfK/SrfK